MKTLAATLLAALVGATVLANDAAQPKKHKLTPEERAERTLRRTGGIIRKAGSAHGKVMFLNAQKRVERKTFDQMFAYIDETIHPDWAWVDIANVKATDPEEDIKKAGGNVGVVLIDSPDYPNLLVAPERGWAVVNVATLAKDANPAQLAGRVRKETMRAFALACGCSFMARGQIVLRGRVRNAADLDGIGMEEYGVEAFYHIGDTLPTFGVTPWVQCEYRDAVKDGWAPVPTNDYQKAIWQKYKVDKERGPSNPIEIPAPNAKK